MTRPSLVFFQYISREDGGVGNGNAEERAWRGATIDWYLLQGHRSIRGKQSRYQFHSGRIPKPDITSPFPVRCWKSSQESLFHLVDRDIPTRHRHVSTVQHQGKSILRYRVSPWPFLEPSLFEYRDPNPSFPFAGFLLVPPILRGTTSLEVPTLSVLEDPGASGRQARSDAQTNCCEWGYGSVFVMSWEWGAKWGKGFPNWARQRVPSVQLP